MSDNLRRYRAIRDALTQWYPGQPTGTVARHLTTLAALISGIVGSKSTQLPSVATKIPDGAKPESRVKRLTRWLDNERILEEVYFLPYVDQLLTQLALKTLVVVMDGSVVGRGCLALMLHVVYKGRALPLAWRVRQSAKGHCPEDLHIAVVALMSTVIPKRAKVFFLGDGEFDGTALQATLSELGWSYVCRTAMSTTATWEGETFRLDVLGACLQPGRLIESQRGLDHTRCVWSSHGAVVLGHGVSRAAVSGEQSGDSRGGVSLVSKALPYRDLFRRPEKSRLPYSSVAYIRPPAPLSVINSSMFSLSLDYLFRRIM